MQADNIVLLVVAALSVLTLTGLALLFKEMRKRLSDEEPQGDDILEALLPYVYKAIMLAYKQSERLIDEGQARLRGIDKYMIASQVYDLLPDSIAIGHVVVPIDIVKDLIPKEKFAGMIDRLFDDFEGWVDGLQEKLGNEVDVILGLDMLVEAQNAHARLA